MVWRKVHDAGAFLEVTDIYPDGRVYVWHFWEDSTVSLYDETTVQERGYRNTQEFLEYHWDYRRAI